MKFTDYALQPYLQKALADLKFTQPTPIQERIIPLLLKGESCLLYTSPSPRDTR